MNILKRKSFWLIIIIFFYLIFTSVYIVQQYETVVVTQFGKPVDVIEKAGLKLKLPYPFQKLYVYDLRINTLDPLASELLTKDKKNLLIDTFVCWRIKNPIKFLQTVIDESGAVARLSDLVLSDIGASFGKTPLDFILSVNNEKIKTEELEKSIKDRIDLLAQKQIGVEIVTFRIKRINYPEQNKRSVFERMVAERERIATQFRSEGEEEAMKIRSNADREKAKILSETKREAEIIRGKADAEATRLYANAFKKYPKFYKFIRTLEAYKKILSKNSVIVIPSDSVLLKYLNNPEVE